MLEKYLASLLVPYLSRYVENIDETQLRVNVWNGEATLQDLILKASALDEVLGVSSSGDNGGVATGRPGSSDIPLVLHRGLCRSVHLSVPFKHLRSQPVLIEVDELFVTLHGRDEAVAGGCSSSSLPTPRAHRSPKAAKWDAVAARKEASLERFEEERKRARETSAAAATAAGSGGEDGSASLAAAKLTGTGKKGSFVSNLAELVINNIRVHVKTVHIRYEEVETKTVVGAILEDVQLVTVDGRTGEATFVDPKGLQRMSKRLVFSGLQMYCDDLQHVMASETTDGYWCTTIAEVTRWCTAMRQRVRAGRVALSTVFGPVSGAVDAKLVFKAFIRDLLRTPYVHLSIQLPSIVAHLTSGQYATAVRTISRFSDGDEFAEYVSQRPTVPVKGNAKMWWRYATHVVRCLVRDYWLERVLARVSEACAMDYHVLYRDVVRKADMSAEKRRMYRFITRFMSVSDMISGRRHVYAQIANEIQLKRKDNEFKRAEALAAQQQQQQQQASARKGGGWLGWLRGGMSTSTAMASYEFGDTEDDKLLEAIEMEYGIDVADMAEEERRDGEMSAELPPSYCWLHLAFDLPVSSMTLVMESGERAVFTLYQLQCRIRLFNRSRSVQFQISMKDLLLSNPAAEGCLESGSALVPNLIEGMERRGDRHASSSKPLMSSVTDRASISGTVDAPLVLQDMLLLDDEQGTRETSPRLSSGAASPLLHVSGFLRPVEQLLSDTELDLALQVHLMPLRVIADPLAVDRILRFFALPAGVDVSTLIRSTRDAASAVGSAASHELRAVVTTMKGVWVSVDACAPVLILPQTLRGSQDETAMTVSLGHFRLETQPLTHAEKQRRLSSAGTGEGMRYYRSTAKFERFFVELTSIGDALSRPERGFMILPEVAVEADFLQRIDDTDNTRERFVLNMRVPMLRFACSTHQVYLLTTMVDAWAPFFHKDGNTQLSKAHDSDPSDNDIHRVEMGKDRGRALGAVRSTGTSAEPRAGGKTSIQDSGPASLLQCKRTVLSRHVKDGYSAFHMTGETAEDQGDMTSARNHTANRSSTLRDGQGSASVVASHVADDKPFIRLRAQVRQLGLYVYEDDPSTHQPLAQPRFSLTFDSADVGATLSSLTSKMQLTLQRPCTADANDAEHPILIGSTLRVDVVLPKGGPANVALVVDSSLSARLGISFLALLEALMDMTNLVLSCTSVRDPVMPSSAPLSTNVSLSGTGVAAGSPATYAHSSVHDRSLLNYQLELVRQQCAMPDTHVADVQVAIHGAVTVEFYARDEGDVYEQLFAFISAEEVEVFLKKNRVTMEVSGAVGRLQLTAAAVHGLHSTACILVQPSLPARGVHSPGEGFVLYDGSPRELLDKEARYKTYDTSLCEDQPGRASSLLSLDWRRASALYGPRTEGTIRSLLSREEDTALLPDRHSLSDLSACQSAVSQTRPTHILFSYRRDLPVMPIFGGKEEDLRYSSFFELDVAASTVTLDIHTVRMLHAYFTEGFFTRVVAVSDRAVYNGKVIPPKLPGPQLLMNVRVLAKNIALTLPVDARSGAGGQFHAVVGRLVTQNSLHAAACQQTTIISLHNIGIVRVMNSSGEGGVDGVEGVGHPDHQQELLPANTLLEVSVRNELDPASEDSLKVDLRAEDLALDVDSDTLVALCSLYRQNLSWKPEGREAASPSLGGGSGAAQAKGDGSAMGVSHGGVGSHEYQSEMTMEARVSPLLPNTTVDVMTSVKLSRFSVRFVDSTLRQPQFALRSNGISALVSSPSNELRLAWKWFEMLDEREGITSTLLRCEEGDVRFAKSLTTSCILQNDFGVRRTALSSKETFLAPESITSSEVTVLEPSAEAGNHSRHTSSGSALRFPSETDIISVAELSLDFSLQCFAVSDQWLNVYDFLCNEAVLGALQAPLSGWAMTGDEGVDTVGSVPGMPAGPPEAGVASTLGFRCRISTPHVVIPFLTVRRVKLAEAHVGSLLVDVVSIPSGTHVAVRLEELEVVDKLSGAGILSKRAPSQPTHDGWAETEEVGQAGGACALTGGVTSGDGVLDGGEPDLSPEGAASGAEAAETPAHELLAERKDADVLRFTFTTDPVSKRHRMVVGLGHLDVLCSLPWLHNFLTYCTDPAQPLAKISSLGVMREQRLRMSQAAQTFTDSSTIAAYLVWHQPRITFVGDAADLADRSHNVEAYLGVMKARVALDRAAGSITATVRLHGLCVPDLLAKTALIVTMSKKDNVEMVKARLEHVGGQFRPVEVEKLLWVLQRNLLLSSVDVEGVESGLAMNQATAVPPLANPLAATGPTSSLTGTPTEMCSTEATPTRHVHVSVSHLLLDIYDVVDVLTHTVRVTDLRTDVYPGDRLTLSVPDIHIVEHFTGRSLLSRTPLDVLGGETSIPEDAIYYERCLRCGDQRLRLSPMSLRVVPKGIGALVNTLLSLQPVPPRTVEANLLCTERLIPTNLPTDSSTKQVLERSDLPAFAPAPSSSSAAVALVSNTFVASMGACRVHFILWEHEVAESCVADAKVEVQRYVDATVQCTVDVGQLSMRDTITANTEYREVLSLYAEEGAERTGFMRFVLRTFPRPPPPTPSMAGEVASVVPSPYYAQRVECTVGSLSFVVVPEVTQVLITLVGELKQHVSEVNRAKAYDYMRERAAEVVREECRLTQVHIVLQRPRLILVRGPTSTRRLQIFPGTITVANTLCYPDAVAEDHDLSRDGLEHIARDKFSLTMEEMGMRLLDESAFAEECWAFLRYERALMAHPWTIKLPLDSPMREGTRGASTSAPATVSANVSELHVRIPALRMRLSRMQTEFLMEVVGALTSMHEVKSLPLAGSPQPVRGGSGGVLSSPSITPSPTQGILGTGDTTTASAGSGLSLSLPGRARGPVPSVLQPAGGGAPLSQVVTSPTRDSQSISRGHSSAVVNTVLHVRVQVDAVAVAVTGHFSLTATAVSLQRTSSTMEGTASALRATEIRLVHFSSSEGDDTVVDCQERTTPGRHSVPPVELFALTDAEVDVTCSPITDDIEHSCSTSQCAVRSSFASLAITCSPAVLRSAREVLYLPFCAHVLHRPAIPLPALELANEPTVLAADLVLDDRHVLRFEDLARCQYELNLNGHRLIFCGLPAAMIILGKHTELLLSNGTVVIPGMFSLASFVSFGMGARLLTDTSCTIEKHYLHHAPLHTRGFAMSQGRPTGASGNAMGAGTVSRKGPPSRKGATPVRLRQGTSSPLPLNSTSSKVNSFGMMEHTSRFVLSTLCKRVRLCISAEDASGLQMTMCMEAQAQYMQDSKNDTALRRNMSLVLRDVHTGANEANVLLPTKLELSVAGVDSLSTVVIMDAFETRLRLPVLRLVVDLAQELAEAVTGGAADGQRAPDVQLEDTQGKSLVAVHDAGECVGCGRSNAFLAHTSNGVGSMCYRCCTGKDRLPSADFRLEVPLVDCVLVCSDGALAHGMIRDVVVLHDACSVVQVGWKANLFTYNNLAAVWEPFLEHMEAIVSGNSTAQSYSVRIARMEVVMSPLNVRLMQTVVHDWSSTRVPQTNRCAVEGGRLAGGTAPTGYEAGTSVTAWATESRQVVEGSRVSSASPRDDVGERTGPMGGPDPSAHPLSRTEPDEKKEEEEVIPILLHLVNHCHVALLVDAVDVPPFGGAVRYTTCHRSLRLCERGGLSTDDSRSCVADLITPPLYTQQGIFLLETRVDWRTDNTSHGLRRMVALTVYPLHPTQSLICLANHLSCNVAWTAGEDASVRSGGRVYLSQESLLQAPLHVRPLRTSDGETYAEAVLPTNGQPPTLQQVLSGVSLRLECLSLTSGAKMAVRVSATCAEMRGGVPAFEILVGPRYTMHNKLPYHVVVTTEPGAPRDPPKRQPSGDVSPISGRRCSAVVEASSRVELFCGTHDLDDVACSLEVHQVCKADDEVFVLHRVFLMDGYLKLRSNRGREMALRVLRQGPVVVLTTPILLANYAPVSLIVRECDISGQTRPRVIDTNFSSLDPVMDGPVAACPEDVSKEDFVVNIFTGHLVSRRVPLHVQQRGLIVLQEESHSSSSAPVSGRQAIHLAYYTITGPTGALLVTITPRWVVANRSCIPIYIGFATRMSVSAIEERAAEVAARVAQHSDAASPNVPSTPRLAQAGGGREGTPGATPPGGADYATFGKGEVTLVPVGTAVALFYSPWCPPHVGYHLHVLQHPSAPLFGAPVDVESIHNETVVAYRLGAGDAASAEGEDRYFEVSILSRDPYTYVVVEDPVAPPFLIVNRTSCLVEMLDTVTSNRVRRMARVPPGGVAALSLDPTASTLARVVLLDTDGQPTSLTDTPVDMETARSGAVLDLSRPASDAAVAASALGLRYAISYGAYGQQVVELLPAQRREVSRVLQSSLPPPVELVVNIALFTTSLVVPGRDIIFAAVTDIRFSGTRRERCESIHFSVRNFQVDNQAEASPKYVSCVLPLRTSAESAAVSCFVARTIVPAKAVIYLEDARLDIVPLALRVSDALLMAVMVWIRQVWNGADASQNLTCPSPAELFDATPRATDLFSTRLVLDRFIINPIVIRVWFTRDMEHDVIREELHSREAALFSRMVRSCEDVKIGAPGIVAVRRSSRLAVFLQWVAKSYVDGMLSQLHGLVFQYATSLPLVGVPLRLVSGLGSGAVRLFREPVEALSTSPKAFAQGLARGSAGFAMEIAGGGLDAFANLANSGARLLSLGGGLSERERRQQSLFTGLASGFTGVVRKPMEGAAEGGASGLIRGVGHGLIGVLANPVSGLLSDVSKHTGTLAKLVTDTYIPEVQRMRPVRDFGATGGVAPWGALLSVMHYQRQTRNDGPNGWSGAALLPGVDGPEWDPCTREAAAASRHNVPAGGWRLDRNQTNFDGWTFSVKYHGPFSQRQTSSTLVRRQRWVATLCLLPYSHVVAGIGLDHGMEQRGTSEVRGRRADAHEKSGAAGPPVSTHQRRSSPICSLDPPSQRSAARVVAPALSNETVTPPMPSSGDPTIASHGTPVRGHPVLATLEVPAVSPPLPGNWPHGPDATPQKQQPPFAGPVVEAFPAMEVYEYERKVPLLGWGKRFLSSECPPWQDAHGREVQSREGIQPPHGWRWAGEWVMVGGDHNGWSVTREDPHLRRRHWQRKMTRSAMKPSSP